MEKDNYKTDIVFRIDTSKNFNGTVFALFPHEVSTIDGLVNCFQHVGQHSSAEYNHCINTSKLATADEYADIKKEMENIGYDINVVKKRNYDKYLQSYKSVRGIKN